MLKDKVKKYVMSDTDTFWKSLGFWEYIEHSGKSWEFIENNYLASAIFYYEKNHGLLDE